MARYDDDDDRGGRYGTHAGRSDWSGQGGRYGGRGRDWDDADDYRSPGGRSLSGQRFEDDDEELGGERRGFSAMDSDERGSSWAGGPGYQESHGPSSRGYDRERPYGRSPGGARYDDDDNRGRDRYWNERGERGWSSERPRREDDDVERGGYGRGASSRADFDRGGSSDRWSSGDRWSGGERWSSAGERPSGERSWGRESSRDWDDDDDRRGWIVGGRSSREDDRQGSGGRGFASMDPERRRELASRGGRASHSSGSDRSWDDDRARGRSSQGSRYEDEQRGESRRGFAAMDPERHRQISRRGGRASHQHDR